MPALLPPPPPRTRDPERVGGFDVLAPLASGGLGRVLLARRSSGELVALKRAHPHLLVSETVRSMLVTEDRVLRAITNEHVVRGLGLVDGRGELAVVMEYVHGVSLAYLLDFAHREAKQLAPEIVARIALDLCSALAATHELGLAHADVNPRNVLVSSEGVTKLCDFGLACAEVDSPMTPALRGTAAYAAPETVLRGAIDRRSDLFSLAATLWEALTVERLFRGPNEPETLRRVVEREAPRVDERRPELTKLATALARALEKEPSRRTESATALASALSSQRAAPRADVAKLVRAWAEPELTRRTRASRQGQ